MDLGFVKNFVGGDDDNRVGETVTGIVVHPTGELEIAKLDLDGQIAFLRPKDGRDSIAWPVGGGMRRIVDARERRMAARPYMLLSAQSLAHPSLPGLAGYDPTVSDISAAMEDRASRVTQLAAVDDEDSTRMVKVAVLLSIGLLIIISAAALPQFLPILGGLASNRMLWLFGIGGIAVAGLAAWKWKSRRRSI